MREPLYYTDGFKILQTVCVCTRARKCSIIQIYMYVCMLYVYMYISMYDAYKLFIYIQITYTTKTHVINDYTISVERILMFSD